jgi:hypothetical protein
MRQKISAHVDGGLSGGSRARRPGSEDPYRRERKFFILVFLLQIKTITVSYFYVYQNCLLSITTLEWHLFDGH